MTQRFRKETKLNAVLMSDVQSQKQLEPNTGQVTREISARQDCASCHDARNYHISQHPVKGTPQNSEQTDSARGRFSAQSIVILQDHEHSLLPSTQPEGATTGKTPLRQQQKYVPQLIDWPGKHESQQRTTQHNPSTSQEEQGYVRHHVSQVLKQIDPSINKNTSPRQ